MESKKISKKDMPPMVHQLLLTDDEVNLKNWLKEYPMDINTIYRKDKQIEATVRYNSLNCLKSCLNQEAETTFMSVIPKILMQAIYYLSFFSSAEMPSAETI